MRNVLRRKPFHRLLLTTAIASLISIPAAFAHGHHNVGSDAGSSDRSTGHSRHHGEAASARSAKNNSHHSHRGQAIAESSDSRNRVHVPDEEELEQPEL